MERFSLGRPASFRALSPGACFAFTFDDQTFLGIKAVEPGGGRTVERCAALWPGHPDFHDKPGLLDEEAVGESVYEIDGAVIVPTNDPKLIVPGGTSDLDAGMLFASGDITVLVVSGRDGNRVFVDVATGGIITGLPGPINVRFMAWRIVQKVLDDFETICRYEYKPGLRIGFSGR